VLPLLKKAGLDSSQPANYRSISNLPTVFKVLERLLLARLWPHLLSSPNFSQFQSAYRKRHSTETALLEVLGGVFTAADDKQVTVLIGLDLSAAFDTVDHRLLLDRLRLQFGVTEVYRSAGCSSISKVGPSSSRWASTNHTPLKSMWASRKGLCWALCCSQSTGAQSPTSSLTTAYSITNMPTTRNSILPCAPTTHPRGCPFSPSVPLMSDSGTCRTVYSSTRTSLKF